MVNESEIRQRVKSITGINPTGNIEFIEDNSNYVDISRGMVLDFHGELYYILGNMYESRFTLEEYPKYWVKSALELSTGRKKILKWKFDEKFVFKIGALNIKCYRSSEKESRILELVEGNLSFMQGKTIPDGKGEGVKIIDYIKGNNLYNHLTNLEMDHEKYFHTQFPGILKNLQAPLEAIRFIHSHNFLHGDIRNDHILIDDASKAYRWIDFDLNQDFSDYDVWSLGNILLFSAGKGEHTFRNVSKNEKIPEKAFNALCEDDVSAFFEYRIINLKKLFPYIPKKLNDILMRFSKNTTVFYDTVDQILDDIDELIEDCNWK
ncbi:hypothetical protein ACFL5V_03430 [Fibrobacterota bacterium]